MTNEPEVMDREQAVEVGTMLAITRAEIDGQIATARAFPRSMASFMREARELVSLDEETAESCIYSLPRGKNQDGSKKFITGASARFAEILQHTFGNNRAGGRVVSIDKDTITAQGVYHDLEKNVQITKEVQRSIVDSYGKRYKPDMIGVTGNAAISIALRNAVLAGIPQALWLPIYEAARQASVGDIPTLTSKRANALAWFAKVGVSPEAIFAKLEVDGVEDIGLEQLETLVGIKTALRRGDYTPERAFAPEQKDTGAATASLGAAVAAKRAGKTEKVDTSTGEVTGAPTMSLKAALDRLHGANTLDELDAVAADFPLIQLKAERDQAHALYDSKALALK